LIGVIPGQIQAVSNILTGNLTAEVT